jgi:hypothetical protein
VQQRQGEKQQRPHESRRRRIIRGAGETRRGALRRSKETYLYITNGMIYM